MSRPELVRLVAGFLVVLFVGFVGLRIALLVLPWEWRLSIEQLLFGWRLRPAYLGAGEPAENLLLCYPMGLALNRAGELLISDRGRDRRGRVVWRIDPNGIAHVVAGSGLIGDGTEDSALDLTLRRPEGLAVGEDGSIFLSDGFNRTVYRIAPDGRVERIAGTGQGELSRPADIRLDASGDLFIADVRNHRVRKVDPSGRISTVAGTGEPGFSPDGTLAVEAQLDTPWGLGLDLDDRLLIADGGNHRVRRVEADGRLVTLAGNGQQGFGGDGGPATEASLNFPEGLFVDPKGRLFIGDEWNNAVRVVDVDGTISTVMGTGFPGRAQIGGVAHASPLDDPENVLHTPEGLIISDGNNGRVIRVSNDGIIHLVAGRSDTAACSPR